MHQAVAQGDGVDQGEQEHVQQNGQPGITRHGHKQRARPKPQRAAVKQPLQQGRVLVPRFFMLAVDGKYADQENNHGQGPDNAQNAGRQIGKEHDHAKHGRWKQPPQRRGLALEHGPHRHKQPPAHGRHPVNDHEHTTEHKGEINAAGAGGGRGKYGQARGQPDPNTPDGAAARSVPVFGQKPHPAQSRKTQEPQKQTRKHYIFKRIPPLGRILRVGETKARAQGRRPFRQCGRGGGQGGDIVAGGGQVIAAPDPVQAAFKFGQNVIQAFQSTPSRTQNLGQALGSLGQLGFGLAHGLNVILKFIPALTRVGCNFYPLGHIFLTQAVHFLVKLGHILQVYGQSGGDFLQGLDAFAQPIAQAPHLAEQGQLLGRMPPGHLKQAGQPGYLRPGVRYPAGQGHGQVFGQVVQSGGFIHQGGQVRSARAPDLGHGIIIHFHGARVRGGRIRLGGLNCLAVLVGLARRAALAQGGLHTRKHHAQGEKNEDQRGPDNQFTVSHLKESHVLSFTTLYACQRHLPVHYFKVRMH